MVTPRFNCYIPRPNLRDPGDFPGHIVDQEHLPEDLRERKYYFPSDSGYEKTIKERYYNTQIK